MINNKEDHNFTMFKIKETLGVDTQTISYSTAKNISREKIPTVLHYCPPSG